jgi:hypothetical protein
MRTTQTDKRLDSPDEAVIVVSPARAQELLDCGPTKLYDLLKAGELESYIDGRARKITLRSINARIHRLLQASRPAA